ncbi:MAG: M64 family metallopeptidase [Candidatus Krumholzibacteriota bacterium]
MNSHRRLLLALLACVLLTSATVSAAEVSFADLFYDETLRIDYNHTGNADEEFVALDQLWRQGTWAGSRTNLLDDLDLGGYYAKIYDGVSGALIWSKGFSSYFGEWQTTGPAAEGILRTYHESVLAPLPRNPVIFALESRDADGALQEFFRTAIDPDSWTVRRDAPPAGIITVDGFIGGDPHGCVDIAIVGEGYTAEETAKFEADVNRFTQLMIGHEPYVSHRDRINVRGVLLPSRESGCDEPSRGVHKRTALGCTFDSLGSERYMLTEDNRAMRDIAQAVPYDVLYIMVNHERYGGGGIYNLFCTFTSDNQWSEYVFLHEFGHSFAGLADEYYTSNVAYTDFYPAGQEPSDRNITALPDPANLKWADLATGGVLPTEWNKAAYDAMDIAYQQERGKINDHIAELMRGGAPEGEIAAAKAAGEKLSLEHQREVDAWFAANPARDVVGAFEGAGYMSEGMYRSQLDCIMFTKGVKPFCAACRRGIVEIIRKYGE